MKRVHRIPEKTVKDNMAVMKRVLCMEQQATDTYVTSAIVAGWSAHKIVITYV